MFADFRAFISRGNVIELAVAVVMGTTFGAIVTSLVNDIIMPSARLFTLWLDFSRLNLRVGTINIAYGNLLQSVLTFLLVAWVSFWLVRMAKRLPRHLLAQPTDALPGSPTPPLPTLPMTTPPAPTAVPTDTELLMEIRDLLKAQAHPMPARRDDAPTKPVTP